jgi:tetratricopeptide (TPR) repeat protein
MKSSERHKIKENEFAHTVARTRELVNQRPREAATTAIAALVVALVVGGYFGWRASQDGKATTLLATALAVAEAPIVVPPPPAPGSAPPVQPPGSFRTERERLEASLPLLQRTADAYPNSDAGITARYRLAASLAELGRYPEAEQRYQEVVRKTGAKNIYHYTARLGAGEAQLAQGKGDAAVATFRELASDPNSTLPVDGVLMQLGRAALLTGKKEDATRAFTRVVDEFPQSLYAGEAKEKLAEIRKA